MGLSQSGTPIGPCSISKPPHSALRPLVLLIPLKNGRIQCKLMSIYTTQVFWKRDGTVSSRQMIREYKFCTPSPSHGASSFWMVLDIGHQLGTLFPPLCIRRKYWLWNSLLQPANLLTYLVVFTMIAFCRCYCMMNYECTGVYRSYKY